MAFPRVQRALLRALRTPSPTLSLSPHDGAHLARALLAPAPPPPHATLTVAGLTLDGPALAALVAAAAVAGRGRLALDLSGCRADASFDLDLAPYVALVAAARGRADGGGFGLRGLRLDALPLRVLCPDGMHVLRELRWLHARGTLLACVWALADALAGMPALVNVDVSARVAAGRADADPERKAGGAGRMDINSVVSMASRAVAHLGPPEGVVPTEDEAPPRYRGEAASGSESDDYEDDEEEDDDGGPRAAMARRLVAHQPLARAYLLSRLHAVRALNGRPVSDAERVSAARRAARLYAHPPGDAACLLSLLRDRELGAARHSLPPRRPLRPKPRRSDPLPCPLSSSSAVLKRPREHCAASASPAEPAPFVLLAAHAAGAAVGAPVGAVEREQEEGDAAPVLRIGEYLTSLRPTRVEEEAGSARQEPRLAPSESRTTCPGLYSPATPGMPSLPVAAPLTPQFSFGTPPLRPVAERVSSARAAKRPALVSQVGDHRVGAFSPAVPRLGRSVWDSSAAGSSSSASVTGDGCTAGLSPGRGQRSVCDDVSCSHAGSASCKGRLESDAPRQAEGKLFGGMFYRSSSIVGLGPSAAAAQTPPQPIASTAGSPSSSFVPMCVSPRFTQAEGPLFRLTVPVSGTGAASSAFASAASGSASGSGSGSGSASASASAAPAPALAGRTGTDKAVHVPDHVFTRTVSTCRKRRIDSRGPCNFTARGFRRQFQASALYRRGAPTVDYLTTSRERPRQFEYNPGVRDQLVYGTYSGNLVVLNQETREVIGSCRVGGGRGHRAPGTRVERMPWAINSPGTVGRSAPDVSKLLGLRGGLPRHFETVQDKLAEAFPKRSFVTECGSYARTAHRSEDATVLGLSWLNKHSGKFLAGTDQGVVHLYDVDMMRTGRDGGCEMMCEDFSRLTSIHANSDDRKYVVSGALAIGIFDMERGICTEMMHNAHSEPMNVIKFAHHDPNILATSSFDRYVKKWDLRESRPGGVGRRPIFARRSENGNVMVCFSPDDEYLLVSAVNNEVLQYHAGDGRLDRRFDIAPTDRKANYTRSYYMNGRDYVISGSCKEDVVRVINARTGRVLREVELDAEHRGLVYVQSLRANPARDFNMSVLLACDGNAAANFELLGNIDLLSRAHAAVGTDFRVS